MHRRNQCHLQVNRYCAEALQAEVPDADIMEALAQSCAAISERTIPLRTGGNHGGYQFLTKGAYHNTVVVHLKQTTKKRLSQAAMETLAIVRTNNPLPNPNSKKYTA